MKVLMTTGTLGGVWTTSLSLVRHLGAAGVEVALVTAGRTLSREQRRELAGLRNVTPVETPYRLEWMHDAWDDVDAMGDRLLAVAEAFEPDVVHLNDYAHGNLPFRAPVLIAGHSCVLSWWAAMHGTHAPTEWSTYRLRVRAGLRSADTVVAPTQWMLDQIARHYGPLQRSRVIPNGHHAGAPLRQSRQSLIFTDGRLRDEAKNVATLCAAAPLVPWPIWVAGEERLPEGCGGGERLRSVRMLGLLTPEQMRLCYAQASIYAMPARYEPFGLTALEAAASGCALVLSDLPSLRETWGGAAQFVPATDPQAWAQALLDVIADDSRRRALAAAAHQRACRFTAAGMADGYLGTYRELVTRRSQEAPDVHASPDGWRFRSAATPPMDLSRGSETGRETHGRNA